MTEYDEVQLPDGQRHPLAGIPQGVLDAAREALREMTTGRLRADGSRDEDDRVLDTEPDAIADSMVNVIRATGWFAQGESELAAQLTEARAALERLADPTPMWRGSGENHTHGEVVAAELADRTAYARRAWLGDRVDRFKITTPNEEER